MNKHTEKKTDDSGDLTDITKIRDDVIQELLIREWLCCFQRNPVYKAYCEAKRKGISNNEICAALGMEPTCIAQLYRDWDDIHALPAMNDDDAWVKWFAEKQGLFKLPSVEVAEPEDWAEQLGNTTLVAIPNGLKKEALQKVFDQFVLNHPEIIGDLPRYEVRRINTMTWADTLKKVQRASLVYDENSGVNDDKASYVEIVRAILKSPEANRYFGFKWSIDNDVERDLFERGESIALEEYRQEAIHLKKFYENCIDQTIHGIFPAVMKG